MSVDILQEKIRKLKNPSVVEICALPDLIPPHISRETEHQGVALAQFYQELLTGLKGIVPAVRFNFASFALFGWEGLAAFRDLAKFASNEGYYVIVDAPELLSVKMAELTAEKFLGQEAAYPCDALIISGYAGSDIIKPFLPYCREGKKDIFVVARTANKSASELQDLLAGGRLVHAVAADHVNRYGADTAGKFGYTRVGILAAASAADSLRSLRTKYPRLFMLLDGADYPNANAKNCSNAFDKFGHGAAACFAVAGAWQQSESDGTDFVAQAVSAAERMKKNLVRYTNVL